MNRTPSNNENDRDPHRHAEPKTTGEDSSTTDILHPRRRQQGGGSVFRAISPIYALFYSYQKRNFRKVLDTADAALDFRSYRSVVDVGCGTGALASVLHSEGFLVTGVDVEPTMLHVGASKPENQAICFRQESVLEGLRLPDKSHEIALASFVAHGLPPNERRIMYAEMNRIASEYVILHDYNQKRSWFVDIIERLEGGDYFGFIENVHQELTQFFGSVQIVPMGVRSHWYVCRTF